MKSAPWIGAVLALGFFVSTTSAGVSMGDRCLLDRVNRRIHGQVVDHTHNHGHDYRIWSEALHEPRDLYVYLPPHFDPDRQYPIALWFHGFREDEKAFLEDIVDVLDKAMECGELPPMIVACADGSIRGRRTFFEAGSFMVNSKAGNFEDYLIHDVWCFLTSHYPVRPEREAHVLMGASMGGFSAYNLAFKHREMFKIVVGIFPPLNLRWLDCHGVYKANFDPCCWGWRTELRPHEVIARFYGIPVRMGQLVKPIYGVGPDAIDSISEENPIELLDRLCIKPCEFDMYIAYAGKDQFNIDAQVESFLYAAKERGLEIEVGYDPTGKHSLRTGLKLFPAIAEWLAQRLAPYVPQ